MGMMHGFTVTPELSVICFIFQLLNTLKECLLSFLTVTSWTFHTVKVFVLLRRGNYHPSTTIWSPALNSQYDSVSEMAANVVLCSCITVTLFGATKTINLCFYQQK